jgi:hypothetical protein
MQQFTVPQFIDVEDKIIGPITSRQFIILLVAAILIALAYRLFDLTLFVTVGSIIFLAAVILSFVRINGRPFHFFLLNLLQTSRRPGLRIWNNRSGSVIDETHIPPLKFDDTHTSKEYYAKSRLAALSLVVDTEGEYRDTEDDEGRNLEIIS